jgi:hypothetical protein
VLNAEEIEAALSGGYELRGFEVKGPGPRTDTHLFAKVTRAALSMGNLRDGGHVVIGIDDGDLPAMLPGLDADDLASWLEPDHVARTVAEYADPPLHLQIASVCLSNGVAVAVIQVFEFADIPHLCAKGYQAKTSGPTEREVLRKGALYVRPRKLPETSEVASSVDMRDIIHLATEKALRAYIETAERAGLALTTTKESTTLRDDESYDEERKRAWS